jgi:type IV pilus assembly protein PilO
MTISLTKMPWYAQVSAFVLISLGGIGAFYYYVEAPARSNMAVRQTQLVALRADISKGYATAKRLPEFRDQVAELEARLDNLRSVLPDEKDVADLLRRLQTVATQSSLVITGFKPSPTVVKQLHAEWPIALQLAGTYHNLASFFDRVGKFARIVNISAVAIKGKDKSEPGSTVTATCVATTFVLLDQEALAKKTAPKGAKPAAAKSAAAKPAVPAGKGA